MRLRNYGLARSLYSLPLNYRNLQSGRWKLMRSRSGATNSFENSFTGRMIPHVHKNLKIS